MQSSFLYKTILDKAENIEFKDRGSKFIGYAYPIIDTNSAKQILKQLKELHPKANHYCYAYRLGIDNNNYRASDDGEPSKSAGYPILGQIDSISITNVLVVVVRYFGGTLLGVSGLVSAYKQTAKLCLENCTLVEKEITELLIIEFDYTLQNEVLRICKEYNLEIQNRVEELFCKFSINIPLKYFEMVKNKFSNLYGVNIIE